MIIFVLIIGNDLDMAIFQTTVNRIFVSFIAMKFINVHSHILHYHFSFCDNDN